MSTRDRGDRRDSQTYEPGYKGRKTGLFISKTLKKNDDGLEDPDDYYLSDEEYEAPESIRKTQLTRNSTPSEPPLPPPPYSPPSKKSNGISKDELMKANVLKQLREDIERDSFASDLDSDSSDDVDEKIRSATKIGSPIKVSFKPSKTTLSGSPSHPQHPKFTSVQQTSHKLKEKSNPLSHKSTQERENHKDIETPVAKSISSGLLLSENKPNAVNFAVTKSRNGIKIRKAKVPTIETNAFYKLDHDNKSLAKGKDDMLKPPSKHSSKASEETVQMAVQSEVQKAKASGSEIHAKKLEKEPGKIPEKPQKEKKTAGQTKGQVKEPIKEKSKDNDKDKNKDRLKEKTKEKTQENVKDKRKDQTEIQPEKEPKVQNVVQPVGKPSEKPSKKLVEELLEPEDEAKPQDKDDHADEQHKVIKVKDISSVRVKDTKIQSKDILPDNIQAKNDTIVGNADNSLFEAPAIGKSSQFDKSKAASLTKNLALNKKKSKSNWPSSGTPKTPSVTLKEKTVASPVFSEPELDGISRRSTRHKVKPLAYWKNEKVIYEMKAEGETVVPEIKEVIEVEDDEIEEIKHSTHPSSRSHTPKRSASPITKSKPSTRRKSIRKTPSVVDLDDERPSKRRRQSFKRVEKIDNQIETVKEEPEETYVLAEGDTIEPQEDHTKPESFKNTNSPLQPQESITSKNGIIYKPENEEEEEECNWINSGKLAIPVFEGPGSGSQLERTVAFGPNSEVFSQTVRNPQDHFVIRTLFDQDCDFCGGGIIEIPGFRSKSLKSNDETYFIFYVIEGFIEVTISGTQFIVTQGCSFEVPMGNFYSLENKRGTMAKLFFIQSKYVPIEAYEDSEFYENGNGNGTET